MPVETKREHQPIFMISARLQRVFSIFIFVLFVILIEYYIGWIRLLSPWSELPALAVGTALLLVLSSYLIRSIRLYFYYQTEIRGFLLPCIKLMMLHNFYNNLLPMRSGELAFPVLMARYFSVAPGKSIPGLIWFRLLDLHTLGLVATGSICVGYFGAGQTVAILAPLMLLPWILYLAQSSLRDKLRTRDNGRITRVMIKVLEGLPRDSTHFWHSWFWTLINWGVKLATFCWVLLMFLDISFAQSLFGVIGAEITSVLPIHSVAGAGTYEAGAVAALLPFGISPGIALQGAVNLHLFLLSATIISGLVAVAIPIGSKQTKDTAEPDDFS